MAKPRRSSRGTGRNKRVPKARARKALQARIDFANSLAGWANEAPQPPTAAKTVNDAIQEIVGELARIQACYHLDQARDGIQDHLVLYDSQMSADEKKDLQEHQDQLEEGMATLGCSKIL